jgi:hypothetical protein
MTAPADAKISLVETQELLEEKEKQIKTLTEALEIKGKLVRRLDSYYQADDNGEAAGDPYCSKCWEVDHKLVHLTKDPLSGARSFCPSCSNVFSRQPTITPGA